MNKNLLAGSEIFRIFSQNNSKIFCASGGKCFYTFFHLQKKFT